MSDLDAANTELKEEGLPPAQSAPGRLETGACRPREIEGEAERPGQTAVRADCRASSSAPEGHAGRAAERRAKGCPLGSLTACAADQPQLLTPEVKTTVAEHAAGNLRVLATMASDLLALADPKGNPASPPVLCAFFDEVTLGRSHLAPRSLNE